MNSAMAGCDIIFEEFASGASRDRPVLARSVSHLLAVIEQLEE